MRQTPHGHGCGTFPASVTDSVPHQFAGVSNTSTLYRRGIRICTGTGIGAALSTCIQSPYWCVRSHLPLPLRGQSS